MTDDPFGVTPTRHEPRGDFPAHTELPGRRVLPLAEARRQARERLDEWRCNRGQRD